MGKVISWAVLVPCDMVFLAYLLQVLAVEKHPANFDHLGRVLGDIHSMLITRSGHMYDNVSVDLLT